MFGFIRKKIDPVEVPRQNGNEVNKPIFTGNYNAFSDFDRHALRSLVQKIPKSYKRIAEIGSWTGNGSTKTILEQISGGRGVLYCIDHWEGNPGVQRHKDLVAEFDMFATFNFNVSQFGGRESVRPLVMPSGEAARIVKDGIFDLVFIDGDHSYGQTLSDIELWLPKVTPGGVLCGHDCESRLTGTPTRTHLWTNRNVDTIDGNRDFPRIHPGVILAVEEKFGNAAHLWAEESITLENGKIGKSTIWDVSVRTN